MNCFSQKRINLQKDLINLKPDDESHAKYVLLHARKKISKVRIHHNTPFSCLGVRDCHEPYRGYLRAPVTPFLIKILKVRDVFEKENSSDSRIFSSEVRQ